jgi:predicted DNA-binding transcriptional regulator AlpA
VVGGRQVRSLPKTGELGPRTTAWKVEDIRDLIEKAG